MSNTELIAEWDAAATPDERGFHNGAGWARDNWRAIRNALEAAEHGVEHYKSLAGSVTDTCNEATDRLVTERDALAERIASAKIRMREIGATAWDEGHESGYDDRLFEERGGSSDPDAGEFPHSNPYRVQS